MEIRQLRAFLAVAEAGSISRAAERLEIAQPSLSQQMRKLEENVGAPLFDRLRQGVSLTEAGRALRPRAERIVTEADAAAAELHADVRRGVGRFAIGAIPTIAPYVLPQVVAAVRRAHPACELEVREDLTENLVDALAEDRLDAAIVSTPIEHERVRLDVVGEERLMVVAPAAGLLEGAATISLAELRSLPRVSLHEMHCLGRQIEGFCSMRRVGANVSCRTTQLATVLELVGAGVGVSLAPEMAARRDASPARRYLRLSRGSPSREIAFATRRGRSRGAVADTAAAAVAEALAED
jgi:LysR family hydrogen peroxide-inducible transcriptional activator